MSDNVKRDGLQGGRRAGSNELREEFPDKFPFEAFEVVPGENENELKMASGWKFNSLWKPPIGIPTVWFTSVVPDWALDCTDGATGYDFGDYPELDNAYFKQFLADFTDFGSADDTTTFDMPDIQGMFARIAGTNGVYGSGIHAGGSVGDYIAHQLQDHGHNHRHLAWSNNDDHAHSPYDTAQGTSYDTSNGYRIPTSYDAANPSSGNHGAETRPCSFSVKIIVRFE